ncbi:MAG: hypothetical protein QF569_28905 [Candidatus Poribacteria bacterium]|nr:hypothetical protein [Candidatus Poribacteria bacterium]
MTFLTTLITMLKMSLVCEQCNGEGYIVDDVEVCPESGAICGTFHICDCQQEKEV